MAKGGGAWKVAYADFVTAMMAFFLVMWICSQNQKIKQAVARYFVAPTGIINTGGSTRAYRTGAIFDSLTSGSVPESEAVILGRGRVGHTEPDDIASNATRVVSNWLTTSDMEAHWQNEAKFVREYAEMSKELLDKPGATEEHAVKHLARLLREQVSQKVQEERNELSQELLSQVLSEINWKELAEDLLDDKSASREPPRQVNRQLDGSPRRAK